MQLLLCGIFFKKLLVLTEILVSIPKWHRKLKGWVGKTFLWFPVPPLFLCSSVREKMAGEHSAGDGIREVTCKGENVCRPAMVAKMSL